MPEAARTSNKPTYPTKRRDYGKFGQKFHCLGGWDDNVCFVDAVCGPLLACSVQAKQAELGHGLQKEKGWSRIIYSLSLPSRSWFPLSVSLSTRISSVPPLNRAPGLQILTIFMKTQMDHKPKSVYGRLLKVTSEAEKITSSTSIVEYGGQYPLPISLCPSPATEFSLRGSPLLNQYILPVTSYSWRIRQLGRGILAGTMCNKYWKMLVRFHSGLTERDGFGRYE